MKTHQEINDRKRAWYKKQERNEAFRATKRSQEWRAKQVLKKKIYAKLGGKCSNPACQWLNLDGTRGCTDSRCLQIDHVLGDAPEDRKKYSLGTSSYYRTVLRDESGRYQLLCANCNWIKRKVNGEDQNARIHTT